MQQQCAVLVVDDEPDMINGLRRILGLDGYHVETAGSIAEMMNRSDWSKYCAILLDRKFPDGFAEEILPELKQIAPHAAVVIMTGHGDLQSTVAAFRAGAEDYLLKPVNPDLLRNCLQRIDAFRTTRDALQREESERKRAEQELQASEEQMRAVLNTAADAIITIDEIGNSLARSVQMSQFAAILNAKVKSRFQTTRQQRTSIALPKNPLATPCDIVLPAGYELFYLCMRIELHWKSATMA